MWEEGVRIYSTPGVPNNFPLKGVKTFLTKNCLAILLKDLFNGS